MKKTSSFSPQRNGSGDDQAPMTYGAIEKYRKNRGLEEGALWISKKMVGEGCTLEQTLHLMEEHCKGCDVISPMFCVEQCETWKVKSELRETNNELLKGDHKLRLLNALKNKRRLTILGILQVRSSSLEIIQQKLSRLGLRHSSETINEYLKPLLNAGLVKAKNGRYGLTLYGRRVQDAVIRHGFGGSLPGHSGGHEEKILRNLLAVPKTRNELSQVVAANSLSRVLRRLLERELIVDNSISDRVFYFPTKRAIYLERLSSTQRRIYKAIPESGVSARYLSKACGISLRRVYKYLRSLRGKKLVFKRAVTTRYGLSKKGRGVAEFLVEIMDIE